ncbi:uncharacterized protein KQ657_001494 [Scheffersomyces spartinae]|uniref:Uncharacterized protein n=1 Tax=Scheffersomyces spartinae TaxID=45513 RepID=A0A9P7V8A4_9ASCO|nr:uncharacterized protein KQ657_001494 [Scheffersomyces spartinae]KAG7192711.1 hypothetical protein KQ657_001494 [Scheffersomyces spartinae]
MLESKWAPKDATSTPIESGAEAQLQSKWSKPITVHGNEQLVSRWANNSDEPKKDEPKTDDHSKASRGHNYGHGQGHRRGKSKDRATGLDTPPDSREKSNSSNKKRHDKSNDKKMGFKQHKEEHTHLDEFELNQNRNGSQEDGNFKLESRNEEKTQVTDAAKSFAERLGLSISSIPAHDDWEDEVESHSHNQGHRGGLKPPKSNWKSPASQKGKNSKSKYETPKQKKDRFTLEQLVQAKKEEEAKKAQVVEEQRKRIEQLWNDDSTKSMNWADFDD